MSLWSKFQPLADEIASVAARVSDYFTGTTIVDNSKRHDEETSRGNAPPITVYYVEAEKAFCAYTVVGGKIQACPRESDRFHKLADIIKIGEGNYESYNTGTKGVPGDKIGHSFFNPPPGTVTNRTINQVLATEPLPGTDPNRMFAVGAYQVTFPRLQGAKEELHLTGDELLTSEMQDKIFEAYLVRPSAREYIKYGKGTADEAQYDLAQEWASIAVPIGFPCEAGPNGEKRISDGTMSFYNLPNRANLTATEQLRKYLIELHQQ